MPVDISSRYRRSPAVEAPDARGNNRPTIGLRLLPQLSPALFSHRMALLETLESIAQQQFGNSRYWWRIADANPRVFPLDWQAGDVLAIPSTTDAGRVTRVRRF